MCECLVLLDQQEVFEQELPDGGVGGGVYVDFYLGPVSSITDPLPHFTGSPLCVRQVVEPGQGVR